MPTDTRTRVAAFFRARAKEYEKSEDPDEKLYRQQLNRIARSIETQRSLTDSDRAFAASWFDDVVGTHRLSSKSDRVDVKLALEALELLEEQGS